MQPLWASTYGNGMLPLMVMVCYHLCNDMLPLMEMVSYRLWKWYLTALGNLFKLLNSVCNCFRQPFMEMEGDCLGNRLWKWKGTVWATAYSNSVLQFAATVSYSLQQQCLTVCSNSVLQLMW
jgi:hypothetical protein